MCYITNMITVSHTARIDVRIHEGRMIPFGAEEWIHIKYTYGAKTFFTNAVKTSINH